MIKKIVAFFVLVCMLLPMCMQVMALDLETEPVLEEFGDITETEDISAIDDTEPSFDVKEAVETDKNLPSKKAEIVYSCVYDSKGQKISISGSVTHDIFIEHRDYSIALYKISPSFTVESALSDEELFPLATAAISIKFNFTVDVKSIEDIFSQYVVVLVSSEGKVDYVGPLLYPSVDSTYTANLSRDNYKGVVISDNNSIYQSEPAVSVVPIYLDKLVSSGSTGYFHSLGGNNIFFDRAYIDALDRTVRTLSNSGSLVYFQFLLNAEKDVDPIESGAFKYDIPDMHSAQVMRDIYLYCDFLSARYSTYKNGYLNGIIIGKNLDDVVLSNNNIYLNEDEYTKALSVYGMIVNLATRKNIPSADIAFSFTNVNTYGETNKTEYSPSTMIESMVEFFEDHYSEKFDFSIVLESSHSPLSISNESLSEGIDTSFKADDDYIVDTNTHIFSSFLNTISKDHISIPQSFMYIWNVDEAISGNALMCAYTYMYYKLFAAEKLSAFVVNLGGSDTHLYDLLNILRHIDTSKGREVTSQLLQFFNKYNWSDVIDGFDGYDYITRTRELLPSASEDFSKAGEFYYFDFGEESNTSSWVAGQGCSNVSLSYSSVFDRALSARFAINEESRVDYAYLLYSYEYPENFAFTPKLDFILSIDGDTVVSDIFEVKISFYNEHDAYESSHIIQSGKERQISIDISKVAEEFLIDSIAISVRPMSEVSGEYRLNILSIKGESDKLSNEELEDKIEEERRLIRNSADESDEETSDEGKIIAIIALAVLATIIGVMLFIFLRREEQ